MKIVSIEPHDIDVLLTQPVHAAPFDFAQDKLRPEGEVEACGRLDLTPFDFASLRTSGIMSHCESESVRIFCDSI